MIMGPRSTLFLSLPLSSHRICLSCPCDRVEEKKGAKIGTCSKNSSTFAHHCELFGVGHVAIYTYWRAGEVGQVLDLARLDH